MNSDKQFQQDLVAVASMYEIDTTLPDDLLVEALEEAGQCGAWEIVQSILYGMDYPVRLPSRRLRNA